MSEKEVQRRLYNMALNESRELRDALSNLTQEKIKLEAEVERLKEIQKNLVDAAKILVTEIKRVQIPPSFSVPKHGLIAAIEQIEKLCKAHATPEGKETPCKS